MADSEEGAAPSPVEEGAAAPTEGEVPVAEKPAAAEGGAGAEGGEGAEQAAAPAEVGGAEGGGGGGAVEGGGGEAEAAAEAPADEGDAAEGNAVAEVPAAEEAAAVEAHPPAEGNPGGFNLPKIEEGFDAWLKGQLEASHADPKDTDAFRYINFTEVPPFTDGHKSLMKQHLSPELFEKLKDVKSSKGYTLSNAIQAGVLRPHLGVGITAGDEECFELFKEIIYPVVQGWHGFDPATQTHTSDLDFSKVVFTEEQAAKFATYVKSTRVRAARNIAGFSLPAGATSEDRLAVEGVLKEAFLSLPEGLQGTYYALGDLTPAQEDELQAGGFLFQKPGPMQLLGAAGAGRNWPEGRGIFHNEAKTVLCWCNEEDQCRIIAMENGGDVKGVFERFCSLSDAIKGAAEKNGKTLMESPNLGFLGTCPSNLGTGLRASVMVVLPELNKDVHKLEEICASFDLQPRGSSGEHSAAVGGKWDISNKQRIGFTEVELVQKMIDGVSKLIAIEEELAAAAAANPPAAAAAAAATAAPAAEGGDDAASTAEQVVAKVFSYNAEQMRLKRTNMEGVLAPKMIGMEWAFGLETQRRNSLHRMSGNKLLTIAGNAVLFLDLETLEQSFFPGIDGGGVGAVAVHPSGEYFAVGEKGVNPNVYIYEYPSMNLYRVLSNGTERAFSDLRFDNDGGMIATVGSAPDYLLHIWDWKQENVLLRTKAFSQEVYSVSFSPRFEGTLYTSGTGHVRFWKMASTFTGLKLQGEIGKFGATELSDTSAYLELKDGKVLSGTETGTLLVWDGGLVKVEVVRGGGKPCHEGMVEVLWFHGDKILSAGADGKILSWDPAAIDILEPSDTSVSVILEPLSVVSIGEGVRIRTIETDPTGELGEWMVLDDGAQGGGLWRVNWKENFQSKKICDSHAGPVMALDPSPRGMYVATAGADGTVRLLDMQAKKQLYLASFPQSATTLQWAPKEVDPEQVTLVVGFGDGVVRMLRELKDGLLLVHVFKPHTKPITGMAFTSTGDIVATGSEDGTIFFMKITKDADGKAKEISPIGFITVGAVVHCLAWCPDGSKLLCCAHGDSRVLEIKRPVEEELDTNATFEITLPTREFPFELKRVIPEKPPPKEMAEGDDDDEVAEPEPEPEIPATGNALACYWVTATSFLVSYDGVETMGKVYECAFESKYPIQEMATHSGPVTMIRLSHSGRYLLTGSVDGQVGVRPIAEGATGDQFFLSRCWRGHLHGIDAQVTGCGMSYDETRLITCAMDGNVHMLKIEEGFAEAAQQALSSAQALKEKEIAAAALLLEELKVKVDAALEEPEPEDIVDPKHYSLQQEKIQAEEDRRLAEAELKKKTLKERVELIREDFEKLLEQNFSLPPGEQLPRDELEIDPGLRVILEREADEKVEEARKELAWISEKKQIALDKLKQSFLDDVAVEYITLLSLRSPYAVSSFRTKKLTQAQREAMDSVHGLIAAEENAGKAAVGGVAGGLGAGAGAVGGAGGTAFGEVDVMKVNLEELEAQGLPKADIRKILRQQRQAKWQQLMSSKPDDKYEDPTDVAAIDEANNHMGDYKLKTDLDYVVPEHLRINADKKRRQMILLEESIYTIKMAFNDRFLALRDLKQRIKENIRADNQRVRDINAELGITGADDGLWEPVNNDAEFPERLLDVSQSEVPRAGGGGGGAPPGGSVGGVTVAAPGGKGAGVGAKKRAGSDYPLSEVELAEEFVRGVQLKYEKERLLDKMDQTVTAFDEAVRNLRRERFRLDADLQMAHLRMLVLLQELRLLKEFEKRDNSLVAKLDSKREEKADVVTKMADCQEKLAARKAEIDKLNPRQVFAELAQLVPETNKFHEQLLKLFKKKIKRQKKKALKEGEEEGEEDEEDEDEDEDDMSDLDEEEEEEEEEFCPPGCDPALYEQVCELREKRLDQEEVLGEFQKAVEVLKKEKEALVKKDKVMDAALRTTEGEIQQFQTFKQQRLNELHVVITLKMHQIRCLVDGKLPADLSHTIVFTNLGLRRLRERIDELKDEKEDLRKNQKLLRKQHLQLLKGKKVKETRLKELEARARDVQMLKFGQEVDLEVLERMSVNTVAEELKGQLQRLEQQNARELRAWEEQIQQAAAELANVTKQNTEKLERVAELTSAQHRLERELNGTQSRMVAEVGPSKERMKAEREQLVSLVKLQAREMEALKAEINMLRRKGGHVYTPSVRKTG